MNAQLRYASLLCYHLIMKTQIKTLYGINRTVYSKNCSFCNKEYWVRKTLLQKQNFCSRTCYDLSRTNEFSCAQCSKVFNRRKSSLSNSRSGLVFCSRNCKDISQRIEGGIKAIQPSHYKEGVYSYRNRALRTYGKICSSCSYSKFEQMLDVDHIDGNHGNGNIDNLQVLCVWCHALKTRKILKHTRFGDIT